LGWSRKGIRAGGIRRLTVLSASAAAVARDQEGKIKPEIDVFERKSKLFWGAKLTTYARRA